MKQWITQSLNELGRKLGIGSIIHGIAATLFFGLILCIAVLVDVLTFAWWMPVAVVVFAMVFYVVWVAKDM